MSTCLFGCWRPVWQDMILRVLDLQKLLDARAGFMSSGGKINRLLERRLPDLEKQNAARASSCIVGVFIK